MTLRSSAPPDRAGESRCRNHRRERCAPDDPDEEYDERSKSQRGNFKPAEDVVIVFNDSARHCPSAKKGGVVDRVPPSRIHKKQIAGDQQSGTNQRTLQESVADQTHLRVRGFIGFSCLRLGKPSSINASISNSNPPAGTLQPPRR
jgi:hypothetical protein